MKKPNLHQLFKPAETAIPVFGKANEIIRDSFSLRDVEHVLLESHDDSFSRVVLVLKLNYGQYASIIYDEPSNFALSYISDSFDEIIRLGLGQKERMELGL